MKLRQNLAFLLYFALILLIFAIFQAFFRETVYSQPANIVLLKI